MPRGIIPAQLMEELQAERNALSEGTARRNWKAELFGVDCWEPFLPRRPLHVLCGIPVCSQRRSRRTHAAKAP
jgi:hypothetical protein